MTARLSALRAGRTLLPINITFSASGTHFCYRQNEPQGPVRPEGLDKLKKFIYLFGSRTRNLPVCSLVPQPLRYRVPPTSLIAELLNIGNQNCVHFDVAFTDDS
jgi:hypothetical protein